MKILLKIEGEEMSVFCACGIPKNHGHKWLMIPNCTCSFVLVCAVGEEASTSNSLKCEPTAFS